VEPVVLDPARGTPSDDVPPAATTALMWSHHWPHEYDRCIRVGGHHLCRRCSVLYPVALVVMAATMALGWPRAADPWLMLTTPLPMTGEWVLEHLGVIRPSGRRLAILTAIAATALGRGWARYMDDRLDPLAWGMAFACGITCAVAAYVGARRRAARAAAAVTVSG
jgi:hypothetical protein